MITMEKPDLNKPAFKVFPGIAKDIVLGKCPTCQKEIKDVGFRDPLSRKEYGISGICQECQDKTFS